MGVEQKFSPDELAKLQAKFPQIAEIARFIAEERPADPNEILIVNFPEGESDPTGEEADFGGDEAGSDGKQAELLITLLLKNPNAILHLGRALNNTVEDKKE